MNSQYDAAYSEWRHDPLAFWAGASKAIRWYKASDSVFDSRGPYGVWFPDSRLNTAFNCLDRHVDDGLGSQIALIWDSAMLGEQRRFTYAQLLDQTARFAGALASLNVTKGDRVLIYMPMIPEAVVAMLACARLGAVHSVVFGGFAPTELAKRISDAKPKVIVSASYGLEPGRTIKYKPLLDEAIAMCEHKPDACVIVQRPTVRAPLVTGRDYDFEELMATARHHAAVSLASTDPLYILYTSGTTGKPRGIVRDNGGHAVALLRSMQMIYGLKQGDVCFTASDIGWVVGHSYIVYGPLLAGCTTILYEGKPVGTPDAGALWRVAAEHKAQTVFTAPTAIRAIRQRDSEGKLCKSHDLSRLEAIFLAGERCDPATAIWLAAILAKPIIDHWWQTETGWALTANFREYGLFPLKPGSAGRPSPGVHLEVLDVDSNIMQSGVNGDLAVALPLPPGAAPTLWNDDEGFKRGYLSAHPGYYTTGDAGRIDLDGDVWVMGRTDDIINVAGHRLSTGAIEEVLASHSAVVECAVVGVRDEIKGQLPLALVVLKHSDEFDEAQLVQDLIDLVRSRIGPIAAFRHAILVRQLPKTRSGKIVRAAIRRLADGEAANPPSTIEDLSVIDSIEASVSKWRQSLVKD